MLQERQVWNKTCQNVAVDDDVLVADERTPRGSWPLGRVLEVYSNRKDGFVRSVKVKTSTTALVRQITKMFCWKQPDHQTISTTFINWLFSYYIVQFNLT
jgi:hypothetical protein